MSLQYTPKQLALALKVSESSVKRWCDQGLIETIRTAGGHRRIELESLYSFLESSNLELVEPHVLGLSPKLLLEQESRSLDAKKSAKLEDNQSVPAGVDASRTSLRPRMSPKESLQEQDHLDRSLQAKLLDQFREAVLSGDEVGSRRAIGQWYAIHQQFAPLADELIAETFRQVGDLWECKEIEVYQERLACEICSRIVHEMRRLVPPPPPNAVVAIGGSPEGDPYTLPSQLTEVVLRECQWNATNLGSNLPFETLLAAAKHHKPRLLWLSVSHIEDESKFIKAFQAFSDALSPETSLIVGGRALNDRVRPQLSFTAYCDNMRQLKNLASAVGNFRRHLDASDN